MFTFTMHESTRVCKTKMRQTLIPPANIVLILHARAGGTTYINEK